MTRLLIARLKADWYKVLIIFAFVTTAVLLNMWYTNHTDRQNRNDWCDLMVALDDRNQQVKNPTAEQAEFFRIIQRLRQRQGCDN